MPSRTQFNGECIQERTRCRFDSEFKWSLQKSCRQNKNNRKVSDIIHRIFCGINKKLDIEETMNGLEKPLRKKIRYKIEETVKKINVERPHADKNN